MESKELRMIMRIIERVAQLVPHYMENEADRAKGDGNVGICLIDSEGLIYGRMFGSDKIRSREAYRVAWTKASQVWITGLKTGEFEKLVFNNELTEEQFGIRKPDYVGWEGGQPITLPDGTFLAAGFSGFRSVTDLEIIRIAVRECLEDNLIIDQQ